MTTGFLRASLIAGVLAANVASAIGPATIANAAPPVPLWRYPPPPCAPEETALIDQDGKDHVCFAVAEKLNNISGLFWSGDLNQLAKIRAGSGTLVTFMVKTKEGNKAQISPNPVMIRPGQYYDWPKDAHEKEYYVESLGLSSR
ncbi:hypothetical protein [Mycobacterium haemophilum]